MTFGKRFRNTGEWEQKLAQKDLDQEKRMHVPSLNQKSVNQEAVNQEAVNQEAVNQEAVSQETSPPSITSSSITSTGASLPASRFSRIQRPQEFTKSAEPFKKNEQLEPDSNSDHTGKLGSLSSAPLGVEGSSSISISEKEKIVEKEKITVAQAFRVRRIPAVASAQGDPSRETRSQEGASSERQAEGQVQPLQTRGGWSESLKGPEHHPKGAPSDVKEPSPRPKVFGARPSNFTPPEKRLSLTKEEQSALKDQWSKEEALAGAQSLAERVPQHVSGEARKTFGHQASSEKYGPAVSASEADMKQAGMKSAGLSGVAWGEGYASRLKTDREWKTLEAMIDRVGEFLKYDPIKMQQEKEKQRQSSPEDRSKYREKLEHFIRHKISPLQKEAYQSMAEALLAHPDEVVYSVVRGGEKTLQVVASDHEHFEHVKIFKGCVVEQVLASATPFDSPEKMFGKIETTVQIMEDWAQDANSNMESLEEIGAPIDLGAGHSVRAHTRSQRSVNPSVLPDDLPNVQQVRSFRPRM